MLVSIFSEIDRWISLLTSRLWFSPLANRGLPRLSRKIAGCAAQRTYVIW